MSTTRTFPGPATNPPNPPPGPAVRRCGRARRVSGSRGGSALLGWTAANLVILGLSLVPVLWLVSLSFKTSDTIDDGRFVPRAWTLENYRGIFDTSLFTRALVNSIGIAVIATALAVVFGSMAAYAVARLRFPGKGVLVGLSLLIAMFPQISLVSPLFNLWRQLGLFDTWPGLIIPYLTFALPLSIYTLSAFFREIPWDLEKAAAMDGATPAQAFRRVIAPLAAPGMVTTAILVFILCWNDFLFAISLTSTDRARTAPAAIAFFTGASQFAQPIGSIAAAAVVITIPIIVFVLLFQRRIVAGLTSGAVKG
jgi:multiple sugar transport system permease protein